MSAFIVSDKTMQAVVQSFRLPDNDRASKLGQTLYDMNARHADSPLSASCAT